jgi:hypothetical protein
MDTATRGARLGGEGRIQKVFFIGWQTSVYQNGGSNLGCAPHDGIENIISSLGITKICLTSCLILYFNYMYSFFVFAEKLSPQMTASFSKGECF